MGRPGCRRLLVPGVTGVRGVPVPSVLLPGTQADGFQPLRPCHLSPDSLCLTVDFAQRRSQGVCAGALGPSLHLRRVCR